MKETPVTNSKPEGGPEVKRPEHKEQISLCPCQKLTQYWGALKGFERHRKCLLVPPPTQQCASNCLNLKVFYLRAAMCVPLTGCHAFERVSRLCSRQLLKCSVFLRVTPM